MTDWFDIFIKIAFPVALFFAGYNIGWSRGFERCRKACDTVFLSFIDTSKTMIDLKKKLKEYEDKEKEDASYHSNWPCNPTADAVIHDIVKDANKYPFGTPGVKRGD